MSNCIILLLLAFAFFYLGFDTGRSQGRTDTLVLCKNLIHGGGDE